MHHPAIIKTKFLYLNKGGYHPDHLGSSSYITDRMGKISQHTEYIAFGEVLFDEHTTETNMPYLFNGKELDQETGLYYYGARYYDPRVSIFLNVDPLVEKTMQPYAYTNNNPVMLVDPDGRKPMDWIRRGIHSNWEYHSNIKSRKQAMDAGFFDYANGRGDAKSTYSTTLSRSGRDIGISQTVVLGENGNYTVNGEVFKAPDHYVDMKPVDDFGKFMTGVISFPILLESSPFLVAGGSTEVLGGKAMFSISTQYLGTGDVNTISVIGDTFGAYGSGEIVGGISEFSAIKLINGKPEFRTVFNGSISSKEAASNIGFALGSKAFGKLNNLTKAGSSKMDKVAIEINNFLIGTGMYHAASVNAKEIQNEQR